MRLYMWTQLFINEYIKDAHCICVYVCVRGEEEIHQQLLSLAVAFNSFPPVYNPYWDQRLYITGFAWCVSLYSRLPFAYYRSSSPACHLVFLHFFYHIMIHGRFHPFTMSGPFIYTPALPFELWSTFAALGQ